MNAHKIAEEIMRANWAPDGPLFERTVLAIQQALIAARDEALDEAVKACEETPNDTCASKFSADICAQEIRKLKKGGVE